MFRKETLISHYIFIVSDCICVTFALLIANVLRFGSVQMLQHDRLYLQVYAVSLAAAVFGETVLHLDRHAFDRGIWQEMIVVLKSTICIGVSNLSYLYVTQNAQDYSRLQMGYFVITYVILDYIVHITVKHLFSNWYRNSRACRKILLVSSSDKVGQILDQFKRTNNWYFQISCIALIDTDRTGESIMGIPVISGREYMCDRIKNLAIDGVFINLSYETHAIVDIKEMLHEFQNMGLVVHVNIDALELDVSNKVVENLGFFKVVSYSSRLFAPGQLAVKRGMDIVGALIGILITIVVGIFVIPAICMESPGPFIFKQKRVGKNGRQFTMYKFRSMYMDAEERKAELMQYNEVQGAMFKMTDDPRITKVGRFIRKYSIDELPQFFNVLKGDMSLVGTRPPTVDEVEKYRTEQKRRLSVTPGMTGMWQVSGRSEIYDFDQIVKLDLEYIDKWSVGLDIKLLFKTIAVCLGGEGAK